MTVAILEAAPPVERLAEEVLGGLRARPRTLPCKYFYDERGSQLFARICELPEYYPTRTELAIMERHGAEMAAAVGPGATLIEFGSGEGVKTRLLLDRLDAPRAYVPIDIARAELERAAGALAARYPGLAVLPVWADFGERLLLPQATPRARRVVYFPGSTIGNFSPAPARDFLRRLGELAEGLLIGVDLKKDPAILHAAYNDAAGVTAEFNRNLLARLNRELEADFDLAAFAHYAPYEPAAGRIAMYLVAQRDQIVAVAGETFAFAEGEAISTEWSYKYTLAEFAALARAAGWRRRRVWTDERRLFSVQFFERSE